MDEQKLMSIFHNVTSQNEPCLIFRIYLKLQDFVEVMQIFWMLSKEKQHMRFEWF